MSVPRDEELFLREEVRFLDDMIVVPHFTCLHIRRLTNCRGCDQQSKGVMPLTPLARCKKRARFWSFCCTGGCDACVLCN